VGLGNGPARARTTRVTLLVRVLVVMLGVATLLGYLDRVSWFFELGTFFRLQYAIVLVVLALPALARRDVPAAATALALAAVNIATIAPHWTPRSAELLDARDRVHLLFANVDVSNHDHRAVAEYLEHGHADVVGITELSPAWLKALTPALAGYRYRVTDVRADAYGIGVFSRRPLSGRVVHLPTDGPPSIVATFRLAGRPVTLVVTHPHTPFGPHAGGLHQQQLRALAAARPHWQARALVCGDLNTPPWSGPLRQLMRHAHLSDSHRGYGFESSWPSWAWPLRLPIDNCLVSPGLAVVERSRGPDVGSDHYPLNVELGAARLR
jgi:endonuclease/exonuclease/phosphatase (EEP) superfamily protein YafD